MQKQYLQFRSDHAGFSSPLTPQLNQCLPIPSTGVKPPAGNKPIAQQALAERIEFKLDQR